MQTIPDIDPLAVIKKYYPTESRAYDFLVQHSVKVAEKACSVAERLLHLNLDLSFIRASAMLHDIGIFLTNESKLGCYGDKAYICHGYLGREILEKEGLPHHALVCERHVGVGISLREIEYKNLPLPKRDMLPVSIEEQIVCYADKFFSKNEQFLLEEKPLGLVRNQILAFGEDKLERFDKWVRMFGA